MVAQAQDLRNRVVRVSLDALHEDLLDSVAVAFDGNRSEAVRHVLDVHAGRIVADQTEGPTVEPREVERFASRRLSTALISAIATTLRGGSRRTDALHLAGVLQKQSDEWVRKGRADMHAGTQSLHADYVLALDRAEAEFKQELLGELRRKGDYKTLLERLWPADFAPTKRTETTTEHRHLPMIVWEKFTLAQTRTFVELLKLGSPGPDDQGITRTARPVGELLPAEFVEDAEWSEAEAPSLEAPALETEKPER